MAVVFCATIMACGRRGPHSFAQLYTDAQSKFDIGDLPAALGDARKGRNNSEKTDLTWNWKFRVLEAEIHIWQGNPAEALSLLEPQPPPSLSFGEFAVRRKLTQARALYSRRNFYDSESRIAEAQTIAQATAPEFLGDVALVRGSLLFLQRKYSEAELELFKARDAANKFNNRMLQARVLGTLAPLYTAQGYYDKAIDRAVDAAKLSDSLHARHLGAAIHLNMGWSYLELGDFDQAILLFSAVEAASAESGLASFRQIALNSLGRIYFNQGKLSLAGKYYQRALALAESLQDDSSAAVCLDNLALVALNAGGLDEATKRNKEALAIKQKRNDRVAILRSLLTAASIADANKDFGGARPLLQEIIYDQKTPISLRWEAEDELARLYVATHQTSQARAQFQKVLGTLGDARHSLHDTQSRLAFSTREADFYTDYIRFLVNQNDPVKALQVGERMHARTLEEGVEPSQPKPRAEVQLAAMQNSLRRQGQIILAYWLAPDKSFLWAIAPSQIKLFFLPPRHEIEDKVQRYQKNVTGLEDVARGDTDGQDLYRILISPAQKLIPPGARVVIIPDGNLGKMNFETLLVPGSPSPHFWIDDVQVAEASSITLLMGFRPSQHPSRKLLVIGNPVQVTSDYPRLTYASEEIKAAAEHFMPAQEMIVSGPDATPSSYASSKPEQFDLIHFATHGFASEASPLDSAIILSPQADNSFKLYARDIMKTRLKADLVTISACYGAGKRIYGEGLVGLAWAFLKAGAHQVIAGLWNVENQSTPVLMGTFYTELVDGKSAAKALRDAKLKMLHSNTVSRFPYYWGVLQLYMGS